MNNSIDYIMKIYLIYIYPLLVHNSLITLLTQTLIPIPNADGIYFHSHILLAGFFAALCFPTFAGVRGFVPEYT